MTAQVVDESFSFSRRDVRRLVTIATLLVVAMTAILGVDILPAPVTAQVGRQAQAEQARLGQLLPRVGLGRLQPLAGQPGDLPLGLR